MDHLFRLDDVSFSYQGERALNCVSFAVTQGQRIAILGANGSGKSTLLRILDGLLFPLAGHVEYRGLPLTEKSLRRETFNARFRKEVALLFQDPDVQLFCPTVWDEIAFGLLQLSISLDEVKARVERALYEFDISHLANRSPHFLSGGEKRRVGLASLLATEPSVLLLDEPTAGLDPRTQSVLTDILLEDSQDRTLVLATHDLNLVADIADLCIVMRRGSVIDIGKPSAILTNSNVLVQANLIRPVRQSVTAVP